MTSVDDRQPVEHEQLGDIAGMSRDLARVIQSASRPVILTHARADADAVGSMCAMESLCRALRTDPIAVTPGDGLIPPALEFILPEAFVAPAQSLVESADLVILVDCADRERANPLFEKAFGQLATDRLLNIDHHVTNTRFADNNLVVPEAAATCEILVRIFEALDIEIEPSTATVLLAGIYGDTLGLKTPSTRPSTMRACADLVEAHAHLDLVVDKLFREKPYSTVLLWGEAQLRAKWRGRLVWSYIDQEILTRSGAESMESEGLVNFLAGTTGAFAAALLQESTDGWRVSLRSTTESVDVSRMAQRWGGGGHPRAAGCRLSPGKDSIERFLEDISAELALLPDSANERSRILTHG